MTIELAAHVESHHDITFIPHDRIHPGPWNHRFGKKLSKEDEASIGALAESIENNGLLHPIVVRKDENDGDGPEYEIVVGERRWRACCQMGMANIPCRVIDVSNDQAEQLVVVENQQRLEMEPLKEAMHFTALFQQTQNWEEVARRVGVTARTVRKMVGLLDLPKEVLSSLEAKKISLDQAFLMIGLPEHVVVEHLLEEIEWDSEDMEFGGVKYTKEVIQRAMGHRLDQAAWPMGEDGLGAGPCSSCTKRTSSDLLLFEEIVEEDRCLDATCWDTKSKLFGQRQVRELLDNGCQEATDAKVKKWLGNTGHLLEPWRGPVQLDEPVPTYLFVGGKERRCKWRTLISPYLKTARPKRFVVVDGQGQAHEVIEQGPVKKWCELNKVFGERKPTALDPKEKSELRKDKINEMAATRVHERVLEELNAGWEEAPPVLCMASVIYTALDRYGVDRVFETPAGEFDSKWKLFKVIEVIRERLANMEVAEYRTRVMVAVQCIRLGWDVKAGWKGELDKDFVAWAQVLDLNVPKMHAQAKSWAAKQLKKEKL